MWWTYSNKLEASFDYALHHAASDTSLQSASGSGIWRDLEVYIGNGVGSFGFDEPDNVSQSVVCAIRAVYMIVKRLEDTINHLPLIVNPFALYWQSPDEYVKHGSPSFQNEGSFHLTGAWP